MKLLFANKFFHLNGGSEQVYFQERDFLLNQGHSVIDFSMQDERNLASPFSEFFVPNINYQDKDGIINRIKQAISFVHSSTAVQQFNELAVKTHPEIVHFHNIYHQLTPSIIPTAKLQGAKTVMTLHDCKLVCPSYLALRGGNICDQCEGNKFWKPFATNCQNSRSRTFLLSLEAYWQLFNKSYDAVDLFIAPSQFMADKVSTRIPSKKIRVLHNGIDINQYRPAYNDEGYALYFGRLSKEKGVTTLLEAHQKLSLGLKLKVVGSGPLENSLRESYPSAEFYGYKTGQELNALIANAAFVVVPSEWYENCSMVVLEAMASGKPVIGSQIGGIPEQIEHEKTGFLFEMRNVDELADRMKILSANPEIRIKMGEAARRKCKNEYSLNKHFTGLTDIYSELLCRDINKDVATELP